MAGINLRDMIALAVALALNIWLFDKLYNALKLGKFGSIAGVVIMIAAVIVIILVTKGAAKKDKDRKTRSVFGKPLERINDEYLHKGIHNILSGLLKRIGKPGRTIAERFNIKHKIPKGLLDSLFMKEWDKLTILMNWILRLEVFTFKKATVDGFNLTAKRLFLEDFEENEYGIKLGHNASIRRFALKHTIAKCGTRSMFPKLGDKEINDVSMAKEMIAEEEKEEGKHEQQSFDNWKEEYIPQLYINEFNREPKHLGYGNVRRGMITTYRPVLDCVRRVILKYNFNESLKGTSLEKDEKVAKDIQDDVVVNVNKSEWSSVNTKHEDAMTNFKKVGMSKLVNNVRNLLLDQYCMHGFMNVHKYKFVSKDAKIEYYEYKIKTENKDSDSDPLKREYKIEPEKEPLKSPKKSPVGMSPEDYEKEPYNISDGKPTPQEIKYDGSFTKDMNIIRSMLETAEEIDDELIEEIKNEVPYIRKVKPIYQHNLIDEELLTEVTKWQEREWYFFLRDMRYGVFKPNTRTYDDYKYSYSEERKYEDVERPSVDSARPTKANPAYDEEAIKEPGNWFYWGKRCYNDETVDSLMQKPVNPYPGISTRGMSLFLRDYFKNMSQQSKKTLRQFDMFVKDTAEVPPEMLAKRLKETE